MNERPRTPRLSALTLLACIGSAISLCAQAPTFQWAKQLPAQTAAAVKTDIQGNLYLALNVSFARQEAALSKLNRDGDVVWTQRVKGSGVTGLALDSTGNIFVCGDPILSKYDRDGNLIWAVQTSNLDRGDGLAALAVATDSSGNGYITGLFSGTVNLSGTVISRGPLFGADIFVAKYDGLGNLQWVRQAGGGISGSIDRGHAIAVDTNGDVYVTGVFVNRANFDGLSVSAFGNIVGGSDMFLAKYDTKGSIEWVVQGGGLSGDVGYGLGIDGEGNVFVTGLLWAENGRTSFFFQEIEVVTEKPNGGREIFIAKCDKAGRFRWVRATGRGINQWPAILVDKAGSCYVAGDTYGVGAKAKCFVAQYDSTGGLRWIQETESEAYFESQPLGFALDSVGNIFLSGDISGDTSFGGTTLTVAKDTTTAFIAKIGSGFSPALKAILDASLVQPTYSVGPKPEEVKDSLVIITHGWNPELRWLDDMTNALTVNLANRGLKNWQVAAYKWEEKARVLIAAPPVGAQIALARGREEGKSLGILLASQKWSHIHLIAHSAGSGLIQEAAEKIRNLSPSTFVHTTFLDPFVGLGYEGKGTYGKDANWSDNYFSKDEETVNKSTDITSGPLDNAYNVDVSFLDSKKVLRGTFRSSWNGAVENCYETVTSHGWPHEFYLKTIVERWPDAKGFGFPMSKEGGNWDSASKEHPVGNSKPLLLGTPDVSCIPDLTVPFPDWKPFTDLVSPLIIKSPTGRSEVNGSGIKLTTGSAAWIGLSFDETNTYNLLSLEAAFLSNGDAQGLLSIYWGTNVIGSIDERIASSGLQRYTFVLPQTESTATRSIGLRLDPFSASSSTAVVTNMTFGWIGPKEPFYLSATGNSTNGVPILELRGQPGFSYRLETSTNLVNWSALATLINTNGVVRFFDTSPALSRRFFRAVVE